MWTRNADLLVAWNDLGYACAVSTHTQHMFRSLLDEEAFVDDERDDREPCGTRTSRRRADGCGGATSARGCAGGCLPRPLT